jgi:hypothetical protein
MHGAFQTVRNLLHRRAAVIVPLRRILLRRRTAGSGSARDGLWLDWSTVRAGFDGWFGRPFQRFPRIAKHRLWIAAHTGRFPPRSRALAERTDFMALAQSDCPRCVHLELPWVRGEELGLGVCVRIPRTSAGGVGLYSGGLCFRQAVEPGRELPLGPRFRQHSGVHREQLPRFRQNRADQSGLSLCGRLRSRLQGAAVEHPAGWLLPLNIGTYLSDDYPFDWCARCELLPQLQRSDFGPGQRCY